MSTTVSTITLTTAHPDSLCLVPVLLIDGRVYGPSDKTPTGDTGAELVQQWATSYAAGDDLGAVDAIYRELRDSLRRLPPQRVEAIATMLEALRDLLATRAKAG